MDQIVQFGPQDRLVGVLSGAALPASAPTLVLPSAGLLPRTGPFRLHVELARRLAQRGVRTFRFDVPGVGEAPRLPGLGPPEATLAALDHLALAYGCRQFAVGGLCSAADAGWHVALADPRVRAVVMLDGISFVGPWFHFARWARLMRRPARDWPGLVGRWWGRNRPGLSAAAPTLDMGDYREWPSRASAQRQFADMLARNVRSLWIYTGGYADRFLHPRQFAWSFGAAVNDERVAMHYWPDCDHNFYDRTHRDRLLDTMENWLIATLIDTSIGTSPIDAIEPTGART